MPESVEGCPLCGADGGELIWSGHALRVIRAEEKGLPAFYRVVWVDHVAEFTDLSPLERRTCMDAVALVEEVLRAELRPDKINLATLGNVVPHLHWHVIARWRTDAHWPQPVWAAPQRETDPALLAQVAARIPAVDVALRAAFAARFDPPDG